MKKLIISLTAILIVGAVCFTSCRKDGGASYTTRAPEATTKAPATTSGLRDEMSEAITNASEAVSEGITDMSEMVSERLTEAGEKISEAGEKISEKIDEAGEKMSSDIANMG